MEGSIHLSRMQCVLIYFGFISFLLVSINIPYNNSWQPKTHQHLKMEKKKGETQKKLKNTNLLNSKQGWIYVRNPQLIFLVLKNTKAREVQHRINSYHQASAHEVQMSKTKLMLKWMPYDKVPISTHFSFVEPIRTHTNLSFAHMENKA